MAEAINIPITADIQQLLSVITNIQQETINLKQNVDNINAALNNMNGNPPTNIKNGVKETNEEVVLLTNSIKEAEKSLKTATNPQEIKRLQGDIREMNAELLKIQSQGAPAVDKLKASTTSAQSVFKSMAKTIGITFTTAALVHFMKSSMEMYNSLLKKELQLKASLGERQELYEGLIEQAITASRETGISRESIISVEAYLAVQGRSKEQIEKMTQAALDLSVVTGGDVTTAVKMLDMTLEGSKGRLGKYSNEVKHMTEAQLMNGEAVDVLAEKYKGLAQASATEMDKLKIVWAEVKEGVGFSLNDTIEGAVTLKDTFAEWFNIVGQGKGPLNSTYDDLEGMAKITDKLADSNWANLTFLGMPEIARQINNITGLLPPVQEKLAETFYETLKAGEMSASELNDTMVKTYDQTEKYYAMWVKASDANPTAKETYELKKKYEQALKLYQLLSKQYKVVSEAEAEKREDDIDMQAINTATNAQLEEMITKYEELGESASTTDEAILKAAKKKLKANEEAQKKWEEYIESVKQAAYMLAQFEIDLLNSFGADALTNADNFYKAQKKILDDQYSANEDYYEKLIALEKSYANEKLLANIRLEKEVSEKAIAEEDLRYLKEKDDIEANYKTLSNYKTLLEKSEEVHNANLLKINKEYTDAVDKLKVDSAIETADKLFKIQQDNDALVFNQTRHTKREELVEAIRVADETYDYTVKNNGDILAAKKDLQNKLKALDEYDLEYQEDYANTIAEMKLKIMDDGIKKQLAAEELRHAKELQRIEKEYANDPVMIAAELELHTKTESDIKKNQNIWGLLGVDANSAQDALQKGFDSAIEMYSDYIKKIADLRKEDVDDLKDRIDESQNALEIELELHKQGFASNVAAKQKEIADLQELKKRALIEEQKALATQRAIEGAEQAISIATAIANIIKNWSDLGPIGAALGIAEAGVMIASFISMQTQAKSITTYEHGGRLMGPSHKNGGIPILINGKYSGQEAEGNEWMINKKSSEAYDKVFYHLNKNNHRAAFFELAKINKIDVGLSNEINEKKNTVEKLVTLAEIKEIREIRDLLKEQGVVYHGKGYRIVKQGNIERRINETE